MNIKKLLPQLLTLLVVILIFGFFSYNAQVNMENRGITFGYGFLSQESSFDVQFSLIEFDGSHSYFRAYLVGLLNTMIEAEEYGITSANADSMKTSDNPAIKRLVGAEGELGAAFGLDNDWSLRIIKQVGNYGESYKRNIADTGILPDRGPNQLWTKGGILYVPPAR